MSLSNVSVVAFHYRSYGTFCIYSKRLYNLYSGFTHYRNYRAEKRSTVCLTPELFFYLHLF
uniref:Transposase n=1 Tax=Streptococcus suis TaxID=1307 RepID=G8DUA4_STRSU|nr:transposase [Streptococcus suis]